ncbi:MAG: phosphatidate cytidylyltransferase [Bacteroidia bacterium]|nr:phosphatidate cytidylyltransferase [Bacteroidia bacterium]
MNNLTKRLLTGVIGASAILAVMLLSPWGLVFFSVLISMLATDEFYRVTGIRNKFAAYTSLFFMLIFWLVEINAWQHWVEIPFSAGLGLTAFLFPLIAIISLYYKNDPDPVKSVALLVVGGIYTFIPFIFYFRMGFADGASAQAGFFPGAGHEYGEYGYRIPLGILFLTWMTDTAAYFGGRFMGKHKLFERISPKKTWEGSITGVVGVFGLATVFHIYWPVGWNWFIVAGILAVVSQLGDLVESMFKRSLDIKDSGSILPGHGGLLDRFDGLFLAIPILYIYQLLENYFAG